MTAMPEVSGFTALQRRRPNGYLLQPFGWAADAIATMVQHDRTLAVDLLTIERSRMHLIALAMANLDCPLSLELAEFLVRQPANAVLDRIFDHRPRGVNRALRHLPKKVLDPIHYRQLIQLLADREAARILYHQRIIDADTIAALIGIPSGLRRIVVTTSGRFLNRMVRFTDSVQLLVQRGVGLSVETVVAELAKAKQPGQFIGKVKGLIEMLPLPQALPPAQVGKARRLERPAEVRQLAKAWHNCLAMCLNRIDDGQSAIYLWEDPKTQAVCLIERMGRFGWAVDTINGPGNTDLAGDTLKIIHEAFADAGIPPAEMFHPLQTIIELL